MTFTRRLREGVRRGEITCSVRIWMRPHVKVGGRYPMDEGEIEVEAIQPISFEDITPDLARRSGFQGVLDLLKVAKHGRGDRVYLVQFRYLPPARPRARVSAGPARGGSRRGSVAGGAAAGSGQRGRPARRGPPRRRR